MKPLEPPDRFHWLAAQGWFELGNDFEAFKELEQICPESSAHPDVLSLRRRIYSRKKNWLNALKLAKTICQLEPNHIFSRIHQEYGAVALSAIARNLRMGPATPVRLPHFFAVPYNLACYACQLGNVDEAWEWLTMAIEMTDLEQIRSLALNDPDLEPLWRKFGTH